MRSKIMLLPVLSIASLLNYGCLHQVRPIGTCQQCVDFEPPVALGAIYGASAGNRSGDVILTSNGTKVSVVDYTKIGGGTLFGNATIATPPYPFGNGQTINTNSIDLGFDFSNVGFTATEVQFEFLDQGGTPNLSLNGSPAYVGPLSAAPSSIAGVSVNVFTLPAGPGVATKGLVVLRGSKITDLVVGGQELWLDNICVK